MPSFARCFTLLAFALLTVAHTEPAARSNRHRDVGVHLVPIAREPGVGESPLPKRRLPSTPESSKRGSLKGRSSRRRCKTKPTNVAAIQKPKATSTSSAQVGTPTPKKSGTSTTTSSSASSADGGGDTSGEPSYMTGTQTGDGTFYATGLGACGITNKDTDHIAAVSHLLFDTYPGYKGGNPNNNPICGRKVIATYKGNSVEVEITDRCTGCAITDLDFSPAAFDLLADEALGRIHPVTWVWA